MKQYQTFRFEGYHYAPEINRIQLRYSLDNEVTFLEKIQLPEGAKTLNEQELAQLDRALFALHLAGGASYYKTCCPQRISVESGTLDQNQAAFWNEFYEKGLGEFFYKNNIDFRGLINFPVTDVTLSSSANQPFDTASAPLRPTQGDNAEHIEGPRFLVPIGGGKDSMVTVELLKQAGYIVTLLRMGEHPIITELANKAGLPLMTIERTLSPNLFELNEDGALNGHVPITGYLSCLSVVLSILYGFDAVTFSNERSANYGNVEYLGTEINHQWSKSLDFEKAFQNYVRTYITPSVNYFSLIRPLSELSVSKLFCSYPAYIPLATSCNTNWRILKEKPEAKWCGTCPKCTFSFALFAAFLPKEILLQTFGKNLFEDITLLPLYRELLGVEGFKPFECVGTPEETRAAFLLIAKKGEFETTPIMQMFHREVEQLIDNPDELLADVLKPSAEHMIPDEFVPIIEKSVRN